MTQNGQGPEPQYPAVPPAQNGGHGGAQPWDGAWGPAGGQPGGQPLPPAQPLPPEAPAGAPGGDAQATQYLAPVPPQQPQHGAPQPYAPQPGYGYPPQGGAAAADMQATQHIAPVPGAMPPVQPQPGYGYPPQGAPGGDMQATQHIAPVPPQQGGGADTQFLGTGRLPQQGAGPAAPAGAADATRFMAPVAGQQAGDRQPPAEFDNLFRSEAPAAPRQTQAPQQHGYGYPPPQAAYPQHQQPQQHQPPQPPQQQYAYQDAYYEEEAPAPRRKSPLALIAAVVVGCAVVGLGAGALLSGGDEDKDPKGTGQNVAASSEPPASSAPASEPAEKPADPAEPQAKELDKLLATSNSSRDTVISSVESIKQCKNLDQAAADLRGAAEQRRGLVTSLKSLSVDKIPDNAALTAALTKAWQASAAADDHYAAWAVQVKDKKNCKGGKARTTPQLLAANEKSGEATTAKRKAAGLWNPTADKYGLERRTATQL
ncbi:hypothetical protein [Streptomyces sp. NPDC003327]